jgi:hypothetical protein
LIYIIYLFIYTVFNINIFNISFIQFRCCGSGNFLSWMTSSYSSNQTEILHDDSGTRLMFTVPKSCCIDPASQNCQDHRLMASNTTTNQYIYTKVGDLKRARNLLFMFCFITAFGLQLIFLIGMRPKTSSQQHSFWYLRVMCQFSVCATANHRTCRLISPFPDISLFRYSFLTLKLKSNVFFETLNCVFKICST